MKELRERGLYRLPDGGEFVVSLAPRGGGYALYDPQVFKRYGLPDYQIDSEGRAQPDGRVNSLAGRRFDRYGSDRDLDRRCWIVPPIRVRRSETALRRERRAVSG